MYYFCLTSLTCVTSHGGLPNHTLTYTYCLDMFNISQITLLWVLLPGNLFSLFASLSFLVMTKDHAKIAQKVLNLFNIYEFLFILITCIYLYNVDFIVDYFCPIWYIMRLIKIMNTIWCFYMIYRSEVVGMKCRELICYQTRIFEVWKVSIFSSTYRVAWSFV